MNTPLKGFLIVAAIPMILASTPVMARALVHSNSILGWADDPSLRAGRDDGDYYGKPEHPFHRGRNVPDPHNPNPLQSQPLP